MEQANKSETDPTEDALVRRAAAGEAQAFQTLIDSAAPMVKRLIERHIDTRLKSRLDASDVLQETFLKASQRLNDFANRRPMPFRIWLVKTAMEQLRDDRVKHLRRQRRTASREVGLPNQSSMALAHELATHSTPSGAAMERERNQALGRMIERLPHADREVLLFRHVDYLKLDEIACILDITASAAQKRYARAIIRLQRLCVENGIKSDWK